MASGRSTPTRLADSLDPDDPDYQRELRRPAVVKEDIKGMESRKRVTQVLNANEFREELQEMVESQLVVAPLLALGKAADVTSSSSAASKNGMFPINDVKGNDCAGYARGERLLRCKLASLSRLLAVRGWCRGLAPLITLRLSREQEHFLCAPVALHCNEVTAASLCILDMQGEPLNPDLGAPDSLQFSVHAAVHATRPDIRCLLHLNAPLAVAISSLQNGLIPLSREAVLCGEVSSHVLNGPINDADSIDQLARDLGPNNKVLMMRNRGVLIGGGSVEEVWSTASYFMTAAEIQLHAMPSGSNAMLSIPEEARQSMREMEGRSDNVLFEAEMRMLDNAGLRTGYVYRRTPTRAALRTSSTDIQTPPSATSFTTTEELSTEERLALAQKQQKRQHWILTPNTYRKQELQESGTNKPKTVSKWVSEGELDTGQRSVPLSITTNPNQFAPQGTNPHELRNTQKKVRQHYYDDTIDAGPQSKLLDGEGWENARHLQEGQNVDQNAVVLVGAASKGIISKDHQLNAQMYGSQLAHNPFANVQDSELRAYTETVKSKSAPVSPRLKDEVSSELASIELEAARRSSSPETTVLAAAPRSTSSLPVMTSSSTVMPSSPPRVTSSADRTQAATTSAPQAASPGVVVRPGDVMVMPARRSTGPTSPKPSDQVCDSRVTSIDELLSHEHSEPESNTRPIPRPRSRVSLNHEYPSDTQPYHEAQNGTELVNNNSLNAGPHDIYDAQKDQTVRQVKRKKKKKNRDSKEATV